MTSVWVSSKEDDDVSDDDTEDDDKGDDYEDEDYDNHDDEDDDAIDNDTNLFSFSIGETETCQRLATSHVLWEGSYYCTPTVCYFIKCPS